ncbi:ParB/RepB/Spo0J family partition protein [Fluviispira sanaruensis]|uniref:Uncharacterized protein n=1 Tax=Fluviispira sanaruensis TaxID=2493639 RepID=A0A4P2VMQ6_FLUSA|nr:ParB/RepB/Spo0J family partition protein [Fluviispira sanaruensis]BBH54693.1 hypothetical protein JCM31447_31670 [Fluviispira sanaruensis]
MNVNSRFEETAENIRSIQFGYNDEIKDIEEVNNSKKIAAINKIKSLKNGSIISLPIHLIDLTKNKRLELICEEDLDFIQLTESIKEIGLLQRPIITVSDDNIFPLEGHRRILALKKLGYDNVSCEVKILETDELNQLTSLIANTARKNWNILAVAKSLRILYEKSYTQERLAQLIGKERTTVLRLLKIAAWSEEIHTLITNNYSNLSQRSLLNIASRKLSDEEILNEIKILCGIESRKVLDKNLRVEKNKSKFDAYIKDKNYSEFEIKLIRDALIALGIIS